MKALSSLTTLLLLIGSFAVSSAHQQSTTKKAASDPANPKTASAPPNPAATGPKPMPLKPATVSGSVFALTKGGDLKPARLAKIYMFYSRALGESADRVVERTADSTFAADVFAKEVLKGLDEAKAWQADKPYLKDTTICNNILTRGYEGAVLKTIQWGEQHQTQIVFGEADEEGKFEITIPPSLKDVSFELGVPRDHFFAPGVYLIVASGMAGYNNAFWRSEVRIEPGATLKVRLSEPEMACLKMDSQ